MQDSKPLVSVGITAYNQAQYLETAVKSACAQRYKNLEILILNNGSQDNTLELAHQLAATDQRIKVFHQAQNIGNVNAFNKLFKRAKGKYYAPLPADDLWLSLEKIKQQVQYMETHPDCTLIGTFIKTINNDGSVRDYQTFATHDADIRHKILRTNQFSYSSLLFNTERVNRQGGFRKTYKYAEDLELWLNMGLSGSFCNLPQFMSARRMYGSNIGEQKRREQIISALKIAKKFRHEYPGFILAALKLSLEYLFFSLPGPIIKPLKKIKQILSRLPQ